MRLAIEFDQGDPPTGHVSARDGAAVPFAGWLELLRVLADLRAAPTSGEATPHGDAP